MHHSAVSRQGHWERSLLASLCCFGMGVAHDFLQVGGSAAEANGGSSSTNLSFTGAGRAGFGCGKTGVTGLWKESVTFVCVMFVLASHSHLQVGAKIRIMRSAMPSTDKKIHASENI